MIGFESRGTITVPIEHGAEIMASLQTNKEKTRGNKEPTGSPTSVVTHVESIPSPPKVHNPKR